MIIFALQHAIHQHNMLIRNDVPFPALEFLPWREPKMPLIEMEVRVFVVVPVPPPGELLRKD